MEWVKYINDVDWEEVWEFLWDGKGEAEECLWDPVWRMWMVLKVKEVMRKKLVKRGKRLGMVMERMW